MRIVDVSAFYAPQGGGVRAYVERKLAVARKLGQEIIAIVPGKTDSVTRYDANAVLETLASPALVFDRRYRYFGDEAALHRALDRWQPDFVEASSPWRSASMVARWEGSARRALVMHADPLSAYAYRWFGPVASVEAIDRGFDFFWEHLRRLGRAYDLVVSANHDLSSRLSKGGMRGVVTMPMGIEPGIFSPGLRDPDYRRQLLAQCGLDPSALLLLGVGRYAPEKRWSMVIDAVLAAGVDRPVGLLLVGEGRLRTRLQMATLGSPHIHILDSVRDRNALARMMASADALVHGCEAETFCIAAAEARASGLPVIVPDRGGAADHADCPPSRRYRAGDVRALRDAILAFAGERRVWRPAGAETPRSFDQHFAELFAAYSELGRNARNAA